MRKKVAWRHMLSSVLMSSSFGYWIPIAFTMTSKEDWVGLCYSCVNLPTFVMTLQADELGLVPLFALFLSVYYLLVTAFIPSSPACTHREECCILWLRRFAAVQSLVLAVADSAAALVSHRIHMDGTAIQPSRPEGDSIKVTKTVVEAAVGKEGSGLWLMAGGWWLMARALVARCLGFSLVPLALSPVFP